MSEKEAKGKAEKTKGKIREDVSKMTGSKESRALSTFNGWEIL